MIRLLLLLLGCLFASVGRAQERHAKVVLDSGEVLVGRVLSLDLTTLQIQIGAELHRIDVNSIKSCRFAPGGSSLEGAEPGAPPSGPGQTPVAETGSIAKERPRITWTAPLPDPIDPEAADALPHDLRHLSPWRARLEVIDAAYPWLAPTVPSQWISLGLLLAVSLSLVICLSVRVTGAEAASFGTSLVLALWYLVTALVQFATVPVNNASIALMLLANPAFALFGISAMFGLTRSGAVIAYTIQLGFVVLGFGLLELINALLASVAVSA